MIDIVDGGLPEHWQTAKDYNETIYYITKQINTRFPRAKNLLISTQWEWMIPPDKNLNSPKYEKEYDNVFILSTVEPVPGNRIADYEAKAKNVYYLGNTTGRGYFSFWGYATKNHKPYTVDEVRPDSFKHAFLSYNRNPHEHRLKLVNQILHNGLEKQGIVTLGDQFYTHNPHVKYPLAFEAAPMTVPEVSDQYVEQGEQEALNESPIPHDIYSLGNMDIWNNTFLVVVTETTVESNMFMSEKIFKPMIGMRPFIVLGDTGIVNHLRACGFRTFHKYFDLDYDMMPSYSMERYQVICDAIKKVADMSEKERRAMYNEMLPDIEHNRENLEWFRDHNQLKIQQKGLFRL